MVTAGFIFVQNFSLAKIFYSEPNQFNILKHQYCINMESAIINWLNFFLNIFKTILNNHSVNPSAFTHEYFPRFMKFKN